MATPSSLGTGGGSDDPNDGFRKAVAAFALFFIFLEIYNFTLSKFEDLFATRYGFNASDANLMSWVALGLLCYLIYHFFKAISPYILVPFVMLFELAISRIPFI